MTEFEFVDYQVVDRVAEITMNKPPVNAVNFKMAREVIDCYYKARDDKGVGAVILTSALGKAFSAGLDLKMVISMTGQELRKLLELFYYEMHEAQYRLGKPTIAAVNATAVAAGVTWAVSCDLIIASEEAKFGYPEINVGLIPAMHVVHLPRQVGRHNAAKLLFTGDPIPAKEMWRMGVINEVVPKDEVMSVARGLARNLADKSPIAMKLLRDAFMRVNDLDYRRAMENVVETMCNLKDSEDSREALAAFVEHRDPVFKGR